MPTLVYVSLTALCALAAYWLMFSQFAMYDDEGFYDYSLKLFVSGHPLYDTVWTTYGPFYYLLFGGFFAAIGHAITTDAGRLIQVVIWVATSLGIGVTAHRLTGRLTLGVTALATAFFLLNGLTPEPMNIGALVGALLSAIAAVVAFVLPARPRLALTVIGVLAAAVVLTKINVGVFAVVAIGFATVMAGRSLHRHAALRWLAAAALVLVGPAVMAAKLNTSWARSFALLALTATLALVFVAFPKDIDSTARDDSVDWLIWMVGGFIGCVVIVLAILFAVGTTPGALVHQMIVLPIHQSSFLTIPITLGDNVIWWSLAAAGLAWTWRQRWRAGGEIILAPNVFVGLLRTAAGVAILLSLAGESLFNVAPNAEFALAMPLAWVAAMPRALDRPTSRERLARLMIPSLATLYCLVAYPVAGTQVPMGSVLLVLCGAVCVSDGWVELEAWNLGRQGAGVAAGAALRALAVVLAIGTTYLYIVQPLQANHNQYRAGAPLLVGGANALHLTAGQGDAIAAVVGLLRSRCHTLMTLPAMSSFNIWTGLPTPTPTIGAQPYWLELSSAQQARLLRAAKASPALCLVHNETLGIEYGEPAANSPLVSYLVRNFRPIAQLPPYTVEVRR